MAENDLVHTQRNGGPHAAIYFVYILYRTQLTAYKGPLLSNLGRGMGDAR